MRTEGIVKKLDGNLAVVSVIRRDSCGGNCSSCGGCEKKEAVTYAENRINASVGDRVRLESDSKRVLGVAFLLYILPVIVFIAVYAVMSELKFNAKGIAVAEFIAVIAYIAFAKLLGISTKITVSVTKIVDRSDGL